MLQIYKTCVADLQKMILQIYKTQLLFNKKRQKMQKSPISSKKWAVLIYFEPSANSVGETPFNFWKCLQAVER